MPQVEFEPMIPAFERAKTVHALDSAATVIGNDLGIGAGISQLFNKAHSGAQVI
jgi:hypothetical protein